MILHDCIQGTQRWLEVRMAIPTASACDRIITPGGAPSKSARGYCNELLAEVILGRPLLGVLTPIMARGQDMEAEAVKYYEFQYNVETIPVGFMTTDDGRVGASPDRLVGDKGLLEVKCPTSEVHSKYLAAHIDALLGASGIGGVYEAYRVQCQTQLYVSEREWSDVISYYPGLPEAVTRVGRDEKFITLLKVELKKFLELFDDRLAKLKALGYIEERKEKQQPDFSQFEVTQADEDRIVADLKERGVLNASGIAQSI